MIFHFFFDMEKYYAEHLNRWKSAYVWEYEITRGHNKFPREGNKLKHKMSVWLIYTMTQFCFIFFFDFFFMFDVYEENIFTN